MFENDSVSLVTSCAHLHRPLVGMVMHVHVVAKR
jgi:hypothetical protein